MIEIFCRDNLNLNGKTYYREAVRAIIMDNNKILLIYSEKNGDYKLPGGGVEEGETYEEALIREVEEEAGVRVSINKELFRVMEYDEGQFDDCDLFKMLSIYYEAHVTKNLKQNLDSYEYEMGFIPKWVEISQAIEKNKEILNSGNFPRWTKRETLILENIFKSLQ